MLSQLYIENIAVIEKAEINFSSGFNVLTGETGAGKSIVIDAINAILGERTSREIVRTGVRSALVSAVFVDVNAKIKSVLQQFGYTMEEDGSLLLQREISIDGKASCRINGRPTTVSVLKELSGFLINIHGQHESYHLLSPDLHIRYLDNMGELESLRTTYREQFEELNRIKSELESYQMDETQKARKMDLLIYQIEEMEAAQLKVGEQQELTEIKNMYLNSEKIALSLNGAKELMDGSDQSEGALVAVSAAANALSEAERYLPSVHKLAERLKNLEYDLEDCSAELRDFSSNLEYDPYELEKTEERLDLIYRLEMKYGETEEEILSFLEKCQQELHNIELSDDNIKRLNTNLKAVQNKAVALAKQLSEKRQKTVKKFVESIKEELTFLDMPGVNFQVEQISCELNSMGADKIQFLLSTNPGEPVKPIAKIASGGELSRIMLAIKNVLAGKDEIDTLIFDEVDTGISGSAAQKVGLKLKEVSKNRQVICVTHLAQIAALANHHLLIKKHTHDQRTFTDVTPLDFESRKHELARIMGGATITQLMLDNADEMLKLAGNTFKKA